MINNHILRSVRYMLDLGDAKVIEIIGLCDPEKMPSREELDAYLKREDEPGFVELKDPLLARFLDGLVIHLRGRNPDLPPRPPEKRVNNNVVLKKLRVAFQLKDADMHEIFEAAGLPVSKPELSAFFRQPGHKNFRPCGDQMLRNFLRGLTLRLRPG